MVDKFVGYYSARETKPITIKCLLEQEYKVELATTASDPLLQRSPALYSTNEPVPSNKNCKFVFLVKRWRVSPFF
jgi:hypothetical protein